MRILGISDGMTGGAAIIEDGKILAAVHEERLIRAKMATGFPRNSINNVLQVSGTNPKDVDAIAIATETEFFRDPAVAYDGWLMREQAPIKEFLLNVSSVVNQVMGASPMMQDSYYKLKRLLGRGRKQAISHVLKEEWGFECPIRFIDHHLAHASSAYFTSGLRDATVITLDGAGDNSSSRVYKVRDGEMERMWNIRSFDSIGNYYAYITHLCGFKAQKHEGKITGLAAYGKPIYADLLRKFVDFEKGSIVNEGKVFYWAAVNKLKKNLPANYDIADLASSMQHVLEEVGTSYVKHWVEKTGVSDLAVAGGVFANVKFNQRVHELENVSSIFIHPGMGDEGIAVGAAYALGRLPDADPAWKFDSQRIDNVYFGPSYGDKEISEAVAAEGLEAAYINEIEPEIARLLASGKVVARFNGRMEYGPRALGNRSLLYQPTDPTVNDWLNKHLNRTEFMPFAPVTLEEYAEDCYVGMNGAKHAAKFMTITFNCKPEMKKTAPAVVHVDGTARPQLVNKDINPSYYRIIDEYRKLTGIPSVINTSFNMHEEPIVCTPSDAIRAFLDGHIDYLAMGNFLLKYPGSE
ncbi:MAG: carbamoyltransferase [Chloroflexi bacterium]|nr:carbamoyltransferase [Chloroflexota bacterium]